jgi:hypothetical protein
VIVSGGGFLGRLTTFLVVVAVLGLVWLGVGLYPDELPERADPDFVDSVFDSRVVVWAARMLLVSAAVVLALGGVYIVVSTVIRMRNGEWLKRAGPFEVSESAAMNLEAQVELWRSAALDRLDEVAELQRRLETADRLIEQLDPLRGIR